MDAVNQAWSRTSELLKGMTPGTRLMLALALAAGVAGLVWQFGREIIPGETYLMGGEAFSAAQLQHMEGALGKAGLTDYQIEGSRVRVPQRQQAKYMAALAEAGALPADFGDYLQKAVNTGGFMLSGSRQEAQLKVAIQSELQSLINNFQGIERSFVQIAEETNQGFPRTKTVTASVGVQPTSNQPLDERTVSAIRWIVASAWGGLKPESVTVVDLNNKRLFAGPLDASRPSAGAYAENKKQLEADWQAKIGRALGIPGAIVTANVELAEGGQFARQVSVCVAIPQAYFAALWQRHQGPPQGARPVRPDPAASEAFERGECERIKQAIVPLLVTSDPGVDRNSLVAVNTIYAEPAIAAPPSFEKLAADWVVKNWRTVGLAALVIVCLWMLKSSVRSSRPATRVASPAEVGTALAGGAQSLFLVTDDEQDGPDGRVPAPHIITDARRAELAEMIRKDPEGAASVLRTWIGNAS